MLCIEIVSVFFWDTKAMCVQNVDYLEYGKLWYVTQTPEPNKWLPGSRKKYLLSNTIIRVLVPTHSPTQTVLEYLSLGIKPSVWEVDLLLQYSPENRKGYFCLHRVPLWLAQYSFTLPPDPNQKAECVVNEGKQCKGKVMPLHARCGPDGA